LQLEKLSDAETTLELLLENIPSGPAALLPRAELALAKRQVREARNLVDEVRRANPTNPVLLRRLGLLLLALREWKALADLARMALKSDETDPLVWLALAESSLRLQQPAEAEQAAQRAIQLKYFMPDAHFVLARALVAQNKWAAARETMAGLLTLQPDNKAVAGYHRRLQRNSN
jgi:predicted Zn-dependent protease